MKTKKILAMLLSAMIVMSATAVSVFADESEQGSGEPETTQTETETPEEGGEGEEGEEGGEGHTCTPDSNWSYDDTDHWKKCTDVNCSEKSESAAHSGGAATCVAKKVCDICGASYGEVNSSAHNMPENWTDGVKACQNVGCEYKLECTHSYEGATCTTGGTCSTCGKIGEVDENEHSYGNWTSNGDGTHTRTCANSAEHKENGNCDTNGEGDACSVCGYKASQGEPPAEEDCTHEGTLEYVQVGDTQHKQRCTAEGCDHETTAVDCTYTDGECVCGREEASTEPEDKPTTGGSSSSSSSSSTTKPTVDTKAEANKISTAKAGSKVEVKIEGSTVPASYVQAALSSKATVVVDYGTYAWEISDVKTVKSVDLSINTNAKYLVNQNELKALKGDNSNVIDIAHDGNLGFKGTLKYNVKKANAGKYVNLYYYNPTTKKLELQGSTKIGADGNVFLPFTHCSTYVLNITATPASGEVFEDLSAGESATVVEETLPVGNAPAATEAPAQTEAAANPATGNSAAALVAIPVAIAAAAIISKKR